MLKKILVIVVISVLLGNLEAKSKRPKNVIISEEGLCFVKTVKVGKRSRKKYMFAGSDGVVYEIINPRYLSNYVDKEVLLRGTVKKKELKDGSTLTSVMPKSVNLIVTGKINAALSKKRKRWRSTLKSADETVYYLSANKKTSTISKNFNGKELRLWGKVTSKKLKSGESRKYIEVAGYDGEKIKVSKRLKKKKSDNFAKTDKKLPEGEMKPGASVTIPLPELGKSASSKDSKPINMTVFLPENYSADRKHPVIVHMSGGLGSSTGAGGWKNVTGNQNFILVSADYSHKKNKEKDLLKLGTCRDFDYEIAAHCLQVLKNTTKIDEKTIILAGVSSGGYSITYSLGCKNSDIFAGFCPIIGGTDRCAKADIGNSSILFVAGENDTQYDRTGLIKSAYNALKKKNPNVELFIQKGVGHSWSHDAYPVQKKWLFTNFANLAKYKKQHELVETSEYPAVKKYFADKIKNSWFLY